MFYKPKILKNLETCMLQWFVQFWNMGVLCTKVTAKFYELGGVLRNQEVHLSIHEKLHEALVRPKLT